VWQKTHPFTDGMNATSLFKTYARTDKLTKNFTNNPS